ncbi:hypothetical protein CaCOL14_008725 [Colletotrichum acutatum]
MGDKPEELGKKLKDLMEAKAPRVLGSTPKLADNTVYVSGSVAECGRKFHDLASSFNDLASSSFAGATEVRVMIRFHKPDVKDWIDRQYQRRANDAKFKAADARSRARMLATNNSSHFAPPPASECDPSISGFSAPRERYPERHSRERSPPQYQQREVQQYRLRDDHSRGGSRHRDTSPFYQSETQRSTHEAGSSRDAQRLSAAKEWAQRQSLLVNKPVKDKWTWQSRTYPPYRKKVHLTRQRQAEFETRGLECLDSSKRFKIAAVCGSCGHKHHYLCDCPIPDESGFVSGCPLCNTTAHNWDDCQRSGELSWVQQYEIMFYRRINMPPIRSRKPWILWEKERIDQGFTSWDLRGVYPWTLAFVARLKQVECPWVRFEFKRWREQRANLPKDPETHRYSAEQLIGHRPLFEERDASSEDNVRDSGNSLQSGFNAAVEWSSFRGDMN